MIDNQTSVPEQVFLDASACRHIAWGYDKTLSRESLERFIQLGAQDRALRAAVTHAYRAGAEAQNQRLVAAWRASDLAFYQAAAAERDRLLEVYRAAQALVTAPFGETVKLMAVLQATIDACALGTPDNTPAGLQGPATNPASSATPGFPVGSAGQRNKYDRRSPTPS